MENNKSGCLLKDTV